MPPIRPAAALATDLACHTLGRGRVVRAARFVLRRSRLDVPNDIATNGESWIQQQILQFSNAGEKVHVIDVGANVGHWSSEMIEVARRAGRLEDLDLHAFEPSTYTFSRLSAAMAGSTVTLKQMALSDKEGSSTLYVSTPGAGTNSLHVQRSDLAPSMAEQITTTTLDFYAQKMIAGCPLLLKVDTEGHDLNVLRGARRLFAAHRVMVAQFEYNFRWMDARSFLRDAFDFLKPLNYRIGKLTPRGVEFYPHWDPELETFVEGNYLACTPAVAERLPMINWWKTAR